MITYEMAKKYVDQHWSVFPVILSLDDKGKVQKKPAVAWREYQERLPNEQELHQWFDSGKHNGIGLATGKLSGVVVVDVDTSKETSFFSELVSKTISGGHHFFYKWTEEIRNDSAIDDRPIDFRGDGGFVVLPPSSLGDQGYLWEKEIQTMYLSAVPKDLKDQLKIRKEVLKTDNSLSLDETGFPKAYEGNRNQTATSVAGMICSHIKPKLLPIIGWGVFKWWNKSSCFPPLDERELLNTWNSILKAENNKPREDPEILITNGDESEKRFNELQILYGEGIETGFDELDRYFKFLPDQLYLLSAPTHQGKTTFALNMASKIATLGYKVLFASLEQGIFIAPRVKTILGGPFPEQLYILETSKTVSIDSLIQTIEDMVEKPRLLVIDHLHFIQKQGNGVTEDIDNMIIDIQNMAKKLHLPVLVIAHVRKLNSDRPPEMDDLRDSSSLSQVPSVVMFLYREKNKSDLLLSSYHSNFGTLIIAKNRIQGKTGVLPFILSMTGEFLFNKEVVKKEVQNAN